MLKDRLLNTITMILFVVGAGCIVWVLMKDWSTVKSASEMGNMDCVREKVVETISDPHMEEAIPGGTNMRVFLNYYNCNSVSREDLVWFRFSDSIKPVVRIVKGVPGDRYELQKLDDKKWSIKINGQAIKTKTGNDYFVESNSVPPLKTYEISRKGILRDKEFILLSSNPPGLTDSSNLGLVKPEKLAGRVFGME